MASSTHPIQYAPWTSDVELAFYQALANIKLNHDKLDSSARKVLGLYEVNARDKPERSARMQIHGTALTTFENVNGYYRAEGLIRNFNTLEEFRSVDKSAHMDRAGRTMWDAISDGTIYSCPSLLCSFSAICYADLKKFKFTYHFAFPCIHSEPPWRLLAPGGDVKAGITHLGQKETEDLVDSVQTWRYSVDNRQHGFFLAKRLRKHVLEAQWRKGLGEIEEEAEDGNMNIPTQKRKKSRTQSLGELGFLWSIGSLASYETGFFDNAEAEDRFVCFADPSTYPENPGWMLRNLLVLVRQRWHLDNVQIMSYRDTRVRRDRPTSLVFSLQSAEPVFPGEPPNNTVNPLMQTRSVPKITGWERNEDNKLMSKMVDLSEYMSTSKLADQAVDLNLKLIKWRISPSIDLDTIKRTSCLLLGAGTLGAYVARGLMAWGVRRITFVDNATVSFSNPVRQPLYDFKDCEDRAKKAFRASDALTDIYPGIESHGVDMSVPMAGHPITDEKAVKKDFDQLKELIDKHDAIFLLMDTRESRWLPTVMAKAAGKIVINAALGFDTYVVMRHGLEPPAPPKPQVAESAEGTVVTQAEDESDPLLAAANAPFPDKSPAKGNNETEELGCYFCSDVVAPADSLKTTTLDQQCTVTRPGAAPIASALAVELLISVLQHRLKARAPAPAPYTTGSANQIQAAPPTDSTLPDSHPLGTVPHQLRGYMSTWQTIQIKGQAYDCCAACSPKILEAYRSDGFEFVKKAINEKGYVEEVSGLAEVQRRAEEMDKEIETWEDDDEDGGMGEGELI